MVDFTKKGFKELKESMFKELTDDNNDSSNKNISVYTLIVMKVPHVCLNSSNCTH